MIEQLFRYVLKIQIRLIIESVLFIFRTGFLYKGEKISSKSCNNYDILS